MSPAQFTKSSTIAQVAVFITGVSRVVTMVGPVTKSDNASKYILNTQSFK